MPEEKDTTRKKNIFLTDEKERDTTSSRRKTERERRDTPSGANQFSVYAQRDTDSVQVDWGVIAKDISDEVTKISDERQTKRDVFATTQRNTLDKLSKVADLTNQSVNNFVIRGGDFSKNAMATQYELMVKGKIKPREWQLFQQNVKDGYANLSTFAKGLDDKYKAAMKRVKELNKEGNPKASEIEIAINEMTFSLTDLKNKQLITNPSTGEMLIVTLQDDGNGNMVIPDLKKNPELYQSLATLNNRTAFQLDRRDTGTLTTAAVAELGEKVISKISDYTVLGGGGGVVKTTDIKEVWPDGKYDVWLNDHVDVVAGKIDNLNNPYASQVLANTGVKFSLKDEPGTIQYRFDGNGTVEYMMTPEQVKKARDIAQYQIESKLIEKVEMTQGFAGKTDPGKNERMKIKTAERKLTQDYNEWGKLWTSSEAGFENISNNKFGQWNNKADADNAKGVKTKYWAKAPTRHEMENGSREIRFYIVGETTPVVVNNRSGETFKSTTEATDEIFNFGNTSQSKAINVLNKDIYEGYGTGGAEGTLDLEKKDSITVAFSKEAPEIYQVGPDTFVGDAEKTLRNLQPFLETFPGMLNNTNIDDGVVKILDEDDNKILSFDTKKISGIKRNNKTEEAEAKAKEAKKMADKILQYIITNVPLKDQVIATQGKRNKGRQPLGKEKSTGINYSRL